MRLFITFILLFCISGASAQKTAKHLAITDPEFNDYFFKTKAPVVSGKIINATQQELKDLSVTYSLVTPFPEFQVSGSAEIKEDGHFSFILDYPFPYQQIWINLGDYFYSGIYVNRGIKLELDFAQLKKQNVTLYGNGAKFLGQDGMVTDWLNRLLLYKREEQLAVYTAISKLDFSQADYMVKLDSLFRIRKGIDNEFINLNPSSYSWIPENERLSDYYEAVLRYAMNNTIEMEIWKKIKQHSAKLVSNSGADFNSALYNYLLKKANGNPISMSKYIERPYADALMLRATDKDKKTNVNLLQKLIDSVQSPWVKTVLQKEHENALDRLNQVNLALSSGSTVKGDSLLGKVIAQYPFDAKLYSASKIKATDFLTNLAAAFKGKAIILDFWATWCPPCIADMPYSLQLHEKVNDLPVEFVYLGTATGSNQEKWQNKIVELKQSGTHVFIDEKLTSELMKMFDKGSFPAYVCFDRNGQVSKSLSISFMRAVSLDDVKKLVLE